MCPDLQQQNSKESQLVPPIVRQTQKIKEPFEPTEATQNNPTENLFNLTPQKNEIQITNFTLNKTVDQNVQANTTGGNFDNLRNLTNNGENSIITENVIENNLNERNPNANNPDQPDLNENIPNDILNGVNLNGNGDEDNFDQNGRNNNMSENGDENAQAARQQVNDLSILNKTITTTYNGDPKALNRFIASIKLADSLINNMDLIINYVLTKLEVKAQEAVSLEPESVQDIINSLKEGIKHKSSKELEGDILGIENGSSILARIHKNS